MKNIFTRSKKNPILKPNKNNAWENLKLYNPGAVFYHGHYHLFYRAVGKGKNWSSSIGYAVAENGVDFTRFTEPLFSPTLTQEKRGLEDPRITKIGNTFYMTYAAYDGITPRLCVATSKDLESWKKHGRALRGFRFTRAGGEYIIWRKGQAKIIDQNKEWSKSGGIFPEQINNKYWMLFGEYRIWLAESDDCLKWKFHKPPFLKPRPGNYFDNTYVEMGPPPIKTSQGWLVIYHGIDNEIFYRLGYLLLDLKDPTKIIYRSKKPIFGPEEPYELSGIVDILPGGLKRMQSMSKNELAKFLSNASNKGIMPKVTFCCGAIARGNNIRIYYGASDSIICTATAKISDILKAN